MIIAGSNGCSAAVRIAIDSPDRVRRLILAWPATAGDPVIDARTRDRLIRQGAAEPVADALLSGSTLRGVSDAELTALTMPVALLPAVPENRQHQRRTVDALLRLLPDAEEVTGSPEPPRLIDPRTDATEPGAAGEAIAALFSSLIWAQLRGTAARTAPRPARGRADRPDILMSRYLP